MRERIERFTELLCTTPGLAGFEQKVCAVVEKEFRACGLEPVTDNIGNCMAKIEGYDPEAPVLMITAHMDSIGFVVKYVTPDGFLKLERVGGIPEKVLPATEVSVGAKDGTYRPGVISVKSHHQTSADEKYTVDRYQSLFVDMGLSSREEVNALGIDIGSPIVYRPKFTRLEGSRFYASYIDDRGALAILLDLAHSLTERKRAATVWLVATVLEEFNFGGAKIAAKSIAPDMAIALDCGGCYDTPDMEGTGFTFLGKGPVMDIYNFHGRGTLNGAFVHPAMERLAEEACRKKGIRLQRQAYVGGLTDASNIQFEGRGGVMCLDYSFPIRFCHAPCELADFRDMEDVSVSVQEMCDSLSRDTDISR